MRTLLEARPEEAVVKGERDAKSFKNLLQS